MPSPVDPCFVLEPASFARPQARVPEGSAVVLPFRPVPRLHNRFTPRDRSEALLWTQEAGLHGYTDILFESAGEGAGHEPGDYMLVYARDTKWASWGIASHADGLTLWNTASGITVGIFTSMRRTLAEIVKASASSV